MAGVAQGLNLTQLKELAREAATRTLGQLRAEISAIERTFPELASHGPARRSPRDLGNSRKRRRDMSAAARKAVSARMKKYWAERRKAKAKVAAKKVNG